MSATILNPTVGIDIEPSSRQHNMRMSAQTTTAATATATAPEAFGIRVRSQAAAAAAAIVNDRDDGDSDSDDGDDSYDSEDLSDDDDDDDDDDQSVSLQDLLMKELFGKQHCLHSASRAARRGYGTRVKLGGEKGGGPSSQKGLPKVSSSTDLLSEEMICTEEAHASFQRFLARKSRSMDNLTLGLHASPKRKTRTTVPPATPPVTKPEEHLRSLLAKRGIVYKSIPASTLASQGFFLEMQRQNYDDYTDHVAFAARSGDLAALKDHISSGRTAQCCNRHKESIIHTICRKGHFDMLQYAMGDAAAGVSMRICCDQFRTPLHDAAWTHQPDFRLIKMILDACPELLYIEDKRGHTPLAYVASVQHRQWCKFLEENIDSLIPTGI